MTRAAPWHLGGHRLLLDRAGALVWPERRLLAVADLHLEKGSAAALRGQLVPPLDTAATLARLHTLVRIYRPATLVLLGDSFHDAGGHSRLRASDAALLARLTSGLTLRWVLGNHDPAPQPDLPGSFHAEHIEHGLSFRHIPGPATAQTPEISGHLHPKARIALRGTEVTRPCFVIDSCRVLMPAFGTYTGGLDLLAPPVAALFPRGGRALLLGEQSIYSFPFAGRRPRQPDLTGRAPAA